MKHRDNLIKLFKLCCDKYQIFEEVVNEDGEGKHLHCLLYFKKAQTQNTLIKKIRRDKNSRLHISAKDWSHAAIKSSGAIRVCCNANKLVYHKKNKYGDLEHMIAQDDNPMKFPDEKYEGNSAASRRQKIEELEAEAKSLQFRRELVKKILKLCPNFCGLRDSGYQWGGYYLN